MRRIVIFIFMTILLVCFINKKKSILIPDLAIRIRVIAGSNDVSDQALKSTNKNEVTSILYKKLEGIDSYKKANSIIKNAIPEIKNLLNNYTTNYELTYGDNYFPEKDYKGIKYDAGYYRSLLIKLGEGKGNNFWCVLFPPLCMIDESKINDVSYGFYVSELLKKIK
jgi:stage II sporulation protein R